jgi:hypothetical protein
MHFGNKYFIINNMTAVFNFIEKLLFPKQEERVKPTPKIQSTAYPDGRIIKH